MKTEDGERDEKRDGKTRGWRGLRRERLERPEDEERLERPEDEERDWRDQRMRRETGETRPLYRLQADEPLQVN